MAPKFKLTYFNVTALAEPIRFLFAYGNIEYEDVRFQREDWPSIKPTTPFGQVPILEIDGKVINQSIAICRYIAKLVKLAGKDDWQALKIDSMVENIYDLRAKISACAYEPDENEKQKKLKTLKEDTLPFLLNRLDKFAKENNGYFVDGELTWADLYFAAVYNYLSYMVKSDFVAEYPNLKKVCDNVYKIPAIKSWIERRPKTEV